MQVAGSFGEAGCRRCVRIRRWRQAVVRGDLEKEQQSPGDQRLVAEGIQS